MARYIDADALINNILTEYGIDPKYCASQDVDGIKAYTDSLILERINAQPTADVAEVKHGKWVGTEFDGYADGNPVYYEWECSVCGCIFEDDEPTYRYCPHCGAKMEVPDEEPT